MVLGVILYETVDLGISAVKLTYRGLRASYYWWYDMEYPEVVYPKEHLTFRSKMRRRLNYAEKESELVPFERRTFWANGALEGTKCDVDDSSCDTIEEAQAIADATAGIRPTASINSQGFEVGANKLKFSM